ncbi:Autoinducer 2 sensor kinase/phosphatase LuxQ [Zhongshania aliphaticivorans]|uniref:histidine kinase n=1 Tax=Zhongshania aliphaticivorans TaxID=1470434 RepID=A0A5S9PQI9_9GAMM|nr:ATP-binding protein [Zhongshania aliphaticivorans]CAA0106448.1 Autoinducer 2 sensor kinase/phosphatase LuxQ [Zhongshania aliphaticivorans]CAA0106591.1 Autoinducer 2 sensor kinase/phosphatase LuxQ [Zhongshania aliphaticivorans]
MSRHRLLQRQLRSASADGSIDVEKLLDLVAAAYADFDSVVERSQRSLAMVSAELGASNEALRAETIRIREFYEYAVDSADLGLWEWQVGQELVDCNPGFKAIIDYSPEANISVAEFMLKSISDEELKALGKRIFSHIRTEDSLFEARINMRKPSGSSYWVLMRGKVIERDATGAPLRMAGTLVDINDQVEYESALAKLGRLSAQIELSLEQKCVQLLALLNKIIGTNFGRINALKAETIEVLYAVGIGALEVGDQNIFRDTICARCVDSESRVRMIPDLQKTDLIDGSSEMFAGIGSYIGAAVFVQGELFGTVCLTSPTPSRFSDIHKYLMQLAAHWLGGEIERDQNQKSLSDAHVESVSANLAKSEFLATMSHEIRTPLNGIMSLVEILRESPADTLQRQRLDTLKRSSETLLSVISDILDFSKIEAGKLELEYKVFDLNTSIRDTVETFQAVASDKGVELTAYCDSDVPIHVNGDEARLKQILNNLLSNALKFTKVGYVTLSVHVESDSGAINFVVKDSGVGMSAEHIAKVFEKFTQADSTTTRRYGGSGLGLTISRQLAELMGGSIHVSSVLGQGSQFSACLPLTRADAGEYLAVESAAEKIVSSDFDMSILLVEDNQVNQYVINTMLQGLGCKTTIAENGLKALESIKAQPFDLVFMDMQMPEMDGIVATEHIRKNAELNAMPIIAMTANALASDRDRCLAAGMNDYLLKPFRKEQLVAMLGKYRV